MTERARIMLQRLGCTGDREQAQSRRIEQLHRIAQALHDPALIEHQHAGQQRCGAIAPVAEGQRRRRAEQHVAGDATGIIVAAVVVASLGLPMWLDLIIEYAAGFAFGLFVFQALFMKSMFSSYRRSLTGTFMSELLSMNTVMGGMTAVMVPWMTHNMDAMSPTGPTFWFVMSISLCAGFVVALPMNWWLVDHGLKHGMMTVRPDGTPVPQAAAVAAASAALSGYRLVPATTPPAETPHQAMPDRPSRGKLASMTLVSFLVFAAGFLIAGLLGTLTMTR